MSKNKEKTMEEIIDEVKEKGIYLEPVDENKDKLKMCSSSRLEVTKDKVLDLLNSKLEGGANIDYLVGLSTVYRNLK